jgi:hypothetical protein
MPDRRGVAGSPSADAVDRGAGWAKAGDAAPSRAIIHAPSTKALLLPYISPLLAGRFIVSEFVSHVMDATERSQVKRASFAPQRRWVVNALSAHTT